MSKTMKFLEGLGRWVLSGQYFHIIGSCLWNIVGVILLNESQQALGPTASLLVAGILLALGIAIWFSHNRVGLIYAIISLLLGIASVFAIKQAVVGNSSDWPSEFWRWTGAILNLVGFVSNFIGIGIVVLRQLKSKQT